MKDKQIHISDMMPIIRELVAEGKEVEISPQGISMLPSIASGDTVILAKPKRPPKKYDIVLYCRDDGTAVLHRVVGTKRNAYIVAGDAQAFSEYPVNENAIVAVALRVMRNGKVIEELGKGKNKYTSRHCRRLKYLRIRAIIAKAYGRIAGR